MGMVAMANPAQGSFFRNRGRLETEHSAFVRITGARYAGFVTRFRRPLPFTLAEFRAFVSGLLGESGNTLCSYCGRRLDLSTLRIEHKIPVDRGGSFGFDNLCASCGPCNSRKGRMTAEAFTELLRFLSTLSDVDRIDVLQRLEQAIKLAISNRRLKKGDSQNGTT
jgi:hypothetical protein